METKKKWNLKDDCEEILRSLIAKHACLQPSSDLFDIWNADAAKEIVADLIIAINASDEIQTAHIKKDWGK